MTEIALNLGRRAKGWAAGPEDIERMGRLLAMCHAASKNRDKFLDRIQSELDTEHDDYSSLVFVEACYQIKNGARFLSGEALYRNHYLFFRVDPAATRLVSRGWNTDACIALCHCHGDPCFHEPYIMAVHNRWKRDGTLPVECLRVGAYNGLQSHIRAMLVEMMPYTLYMVNEYFELASEAEADAVLAHAATGGVASLRAVQILLWSQFDMHAHEAVMGLLALAPQDAESYMEKPELDECRVGLEDGAKLARSIAYRAAQKKPEWAAEIIHYAPNTIHSVVSALYRKSDALINVLSRCTSATPLYANALLSVARRRENDAASEYATGMLIAHLVHADEHEVIAKAIMDNQLWRSCPIAHAAEMCMAHEAEFPARPLNPAYKMLLTYEDASDTAIMHRRGSGHYVPNREYRDQCMRAYLDDPSTIALLFGVPGTQLERDIYVFAVSTESYGIEDLRCLVQAMHENPPVSEDDLEWRNDVLRKVPRKVLLESGLDEDPVLFPPQSQLGAELHAAFYTAEVQFSESEFDASAARCESQRTLVRIMDYLVKKWSFYTPDWLWRWACKLGTYPPVAHHAFVLAIHVSTCPDQIAIAVSHALKALAMIRPGREALLVDQLACACESVRHGPAVRADICRIARLPPDSFAVPQITSAHMAYVLRHFIGSIPQRSE